MATCGAQSTSTKGKRSMPPLQGAHSCGCRAQHEMPVGGVHAHRHSHPVRGVCRIDSGALIPVEISATVTNSAAGHAAEVATAGATQTVQVRAKPAGRGSSVNGGEFLMLALATCYCNDVFREAARLGITVDSVEVQACADFPGTGLAATNVRYRAKIESSASPEDIEQLMLQTDAVAEVHNTLRTGVPVQLVGD